MSANTKLNSHQDPSIAQNSSRAAIPIAPPAAMTGVTVAAAIPVEVFADGNVLLVEEICPLTLFPAEVFADVVGCWRELTLDEPLERVPLLKG